MWAEAKPDLLEAVVARRQQIGLRLAIGAGMALGLGALFGWQLVGVWIAAWYGIQIGEYVWSGHIDRRVKAGHRVSAVPPLALMVLTNAVFGALAVVALLTGKTWSMVVGVWILTGALLNAAAMSRASRAAYVANALPSAILCALTAPIAWTMGATPAETFGLFTGGVLLLIASYVLRAVSQRALQDAKAASAAKSAFLANMSHEIRTPLNGVLGMAQAMAADDLPAEQRERLQVIRRSGEALMALLNDVLDLSKIEAGKVELEEGSVDFAAMGQELEASFQALCAAKDIYLSVETEPSTLGVWAGDPTRIRQVLSNLIGNAVKFTDRGCVEARIGHDGEGILITVTDTGPGIAPERLGRLFDKFVQEDVTTTRRYGGTGLGLSICRELVELMGGEIGAESVVGEGSTFTVRLPLVRSYATPAAEPPPDRYLVTDQPLRVLAAEDHEMNQAVLKVMLSQLGFEATIVGNGREAVTAWEQGGWDVILMDVQMPIMDGPTATRAIRQRERASGEAPTPIVALTANAMSHQVAEYLGCGMNAFVSKPLELPKLVAAIAEVLGDQPAREQDPAVHRGAAI